MNRLPWADIDNCPARKALGHFISLAGQLSTSAPVHPCIEKRGVLPMT